MQPAEVLQSRFAAKKVKNASFIIARVPHAMRAAVRSVKVYINLSRVTPVGDACPRFEYKDYNNLPRVTAAGHARYMM